MHCGLTCSSQTCLITDRVASFQHKDDFSSAISLSAGSLALAADLLKISFFKKWIYLLLLFSWSEIMWLHFSLENILNSRSNMDIVTVFIYFSIKHNWDHTHSPPPPPSQPHIQFIISLLNQPLCFQLPSVTLVDMSVSRRSLYWVQKVTSVVMVAILIHFICFSFLSSVVCRHIVMIDHSKKHYNYPLMLLPLSLTQR